MSILCSEEELRYNRQIMLRQFDFDGQEALKKARVLVIGLGGLGCAASQYLAAAGVGHLTLVDDDKVEISNLARQILHDDQRVGMDKVHSAALSLQKLNPFLQTACINQRLNEQALLEQICQHDIVLDCSDNLPTRNGLNQLCFERKKPLVSGAAIRLEGQISVFTYKKDQACYQCLSQLFGEQNLSCAESGILSPVVGVIGAMQALETIKLITGLYKADNTTLLFFDALASSWQTFALAKNSDCKVCAGVIRNEK